MNWGYCDPGRQVPSRPGEQRACSATPCPATRSFPATPWTPSTGAGAGVGTGGTITGTGRYLKEQNAAIEVIGADPFGSIYSSPEVKPYLVEGVGEDFWPYGFDRNRATLATFLRHHHEQGLSKRRLEAEALFAPETLDT